MKYPVSQLLQQRAFPLTFLNKLSSGEMGLLSTPWNQSVDTEMLQKTTWVKMVNLRVINKKDKAWRYASFWNACLTGAKLRDIQASCNMAFPRKMFCIKQWYSNLFLSLVFFSQSNHYNFKRCKWGCRLDSIDWLHKTNDEGPVENKKYMNGVKFPGKSVTCCLTNSAHTSSLYFFH